MEQTLKERLEPGEQLLWMGRPVKSKLMEAPDSTMQKVMWAVLAAFLLFTAAVILPYMGAAGQSITVMGVCVIIVNVVPFVLAIRPMLDQKLLEKKTVCAVTDRRVISVVKDTVHTMDRKDLDFAVSNREGSVGSIRFGGAVHCKKKNDRVDAVLGVQEDEGQAKGMVFFRVENVDQVAALLGQPVAAK